MTNYNHKFKKNLIADWIGRDLSAAVRGGVGRKLSKESLLVFPLITASLVVSTFANAQTVSNLQPIVVDREIYEFINSPDEVFNIDINSDDDTLNSGISIDENSILDIDFIQSLNIKYQEENKLSTSSVQGITVNHGSTGTINTSSDINIELQAEKSYIRGIHNNASNDNSALTLNSLNGSINIDVSNVNSPASNVHGIENYSGGAVNLIASQNISISAAISVNADNANISAIQNGLGSSDTKGSTLLTAGGYIELSANGNGTSNGILNTRNFETKLTANNKNSSGYGIDIRATSSGLNAYAVNTEGAIELIANNGGIFLAAEGATESNRALNSSSGKVNLVASENIILEAKGNATVDSSAIYAYHNEIDSFKVQGKSVSLTAENNSGKSSGVYAQGGNVEIFSDDVTVVSSSKIGLDSAFDVNPESLEGHSSSISIFSSTNYVEAKSTSLRSTNSDLTLIATGTNSVIDATVEDQTGKNIVVSEHTGLWTLDSGKISLTASIGNYVDTKYYAAYAQSGEILLESNSGLNSIFSQYAGLWAQDAGKITLSAGRENSINGSSYGVYVTSGEVLLKSENGINRVESPNATAIRTIGANSVVTIDTTSQDASSIKGTNYLVADTAYWAQGGELKLKAVEGNYLDVINNGLFVDQSGIALLEVSNGVNRIESGTLTETNGITSGNGQAIYVTANGLATLNSLNGNNEILGYIRTYKGDSSKIALTASNNLISSTNTYTVSATNGPISLHANRTGTDNSGNNFIYSKYANGYGEGLAIQALSKGSVGISAQETNSIFGAISSKNEGSSVSVDGKTNTVKSYAVISNAGNLNSATDDKFKDNRVISALYAEGTGAKISLTGEQNYLSTFADSEVHTDLERVVWAYDGADINIDGFTSITTDSYKKSLNSIDIAIAAGTAVNLTEDKVNEDVAHRAQVQINYANSTDSEGKAVLSSVTGDILSAYAGSVNIAPKSTTSDGLVVTGNLLAGNNGELTVDIGANGVLTGRADDYGDAGFIKDSEHTTFFDPAFSSEIFKGGQVNLKMGDNARWNVTGQSWITDISVADGAKNVLIDLVNANTDRNSTAHALTVYNLKGNATFNMNLDGNRDVSDMLYIRNANGEYNVNVVDAVTVDDMYKGGLNGLRFATVGAGSKAKFRAFTYDKGALNVEYEVATDSYDNNPENDIYNGTEMSHEKPGSTVVDGLFGYEEGAVATLALNDEAATKAADGTISETTNFKLVDRKDATPSDSGKTIIDHARANYANAVQLDTLNKRQGEMRFSQGHEDGLWARIRHDDIGKRSSFRLDNTMVEVGVDSRYVKETGEFHTGVAFDYMNGDTDYHHISGEGDLDRYGVWFYTTWLGNEGDYTDFIIKCSLIDNEYKIYAPTTGEKITGDYDNNVISVSLEHGKKYSNEESWFIEPQAQLQYAYVTSAEYTNSQGTDVRLDGIHSLIGRVGVRAGKDVTRDNPFTFYARGDIMHEFMGKQDIKAKDATGTMRVRYENDDTWYSAGLGMSYLHNKDKYYFLEAEKVFGGSNTSSYIVSGGVRFLFD